MSLQSLPQNVLGRIGDFLTPEDRERMRSLSGEFNTIYNSRTRRAFTINQRLTMRDLQGGQKVSIDTQEVILNQRNFSTQLGTTQQLKRMLRETELEGTMYSNGRWMRALYKPRLVDGVRLPGFGLSALTTYKNNYFPEYVDWADDCFYLLNNLMDYPFRKDLSGFLNKNYSLFTPEEIQASIERKSNSDHYPLTLVKIKDINLIDYAIKLRRLPGDTYEAVKLNTVNELQQWGLPGSPMAAELIGRYLGGNGDTSIEGLRPLLNYRYMHEIFIDIYYDDSDDSDASEPMSFPLEEGGARVAGAKRQRE